MLAGIITRVVLDCRAHLDELVSAALAFVAEVHPRERGDHTDDVRVLQITHNLHFLMVTMLVYFVGELLLLERDGLYSIYIVVSPTPHLSHYAKSATAE